MSEKLANVRSADNVDLAVQVVSVDKTSGYRVQAHMIKFELNEQKEAKVLKKVSAYHEDLTLEAAQNGAIERAAYLLGL